MSHVHSLSAQAQLTVKTSVCILDFLKLSHDFGSDWPDLVIWPPQLQRRLGKVDQIDMLPSCSQKYYHAKEEENGYCVGVHIMSYFPIHHESRKEVFGVLRIMCWTRENAYEPGRHPVQGEGSAEEE